MTDKKPKVLHVVGDSEYGGASKVIRDISSAAQDAGYDVRVLTTNSAFISELNMLGIAAVPLDCVRRRISLFDFVGIARLHRHLRRERYDVVHTHTSKGGVIGRIAARAAAIPAVVHTVHGYAFHEATPTLKRGLIVAAETFAAMFCHRVVTVSEHHARTTIELGIASEKKTLAIPNGIPDASPIEGDFVRPTPSAPLRLLFFGRLAPQKGLPYLLETLHALIAKDIPTHLAIVGTGPSEDDLREQVAAKGLTDFVEFAGFQTEAEIRDHLSAADIVVLPSLWEGLSIALLEALRAGAAVVTTEIPSNLEVVGRTECAALVEPRSPAALAQTIEQLAHDPGRLELLRSRARRRFTERYTVDRMQASYMDLYGSLLHHREVL